MAGHSPPTRRRRLLRLLLLATLSAPILLWLVVLLALATPWPRAWLAGKLTQRTGLPTKIGGIALSPSQGIQLKDYRLHLPGQAKGKPIITIPIIRLHPDWQLLAHKKLDILSLELDSPTIDIPLEALAAALPKPTTLPAKPPEPQIAANDTPKPTEQSPNPQATPEAAPEAKPTVPQKPVPPLQLPPTRWLHIRNASVRIHSARHHRDILRVTRFTTSLPVIGKPATTTASLSSAQLLDLPPLSPTTIPIEWNGSVLRVPTLEQTTANGLHFTIDAYLAPVKSLPCVIEAKLLKQAVPKTDLTADSTAQATDLTAYAQFKGALASPASWQALLLAEAHDLQLSKSDTRHSFDHATLAATLHNGILQATNIRLSSEDIAILANAAALPDGRTAANARLVTSPERATHIARDFFPTVQNIPLTPLSTPQRVALDLQAIGTLGSQFQIQIGPQLPLETDH